MSTFSEYKRLTELHTERRTHVQSAQLLFEMHALRCIGALVVWNTIESSRRKYMVKH